MSLPRDIVSGYVIGAAGIVLVVTLKFGLEAIFETTFTGLFFTPVILAAAAIGGLAPGAFTTALSLPVIYYFAFGNLEPVQGLDLVLFTGVGFGIAWLGGSMRDARNRALSTSRQLQRRESYLQSILDSISDATVAIRANGEIVSFNAAAERHFGYRERDVLSRNVKMLMPEPYHSEHDDYLSRYHKTGMARMIGNARVVSGRRRDGSTFPMSLEIVEMQSGEEALFIGFVQDLTERQLAETERERTQDQLARLSRLNEMGEMATSLAHEINQPLTAIANYMQGSRRMLQAFNPSMLPQLRAALEAAADQALRAGDIIRHMRAFVTVGETDKQIVDIADLIRDAAALGLVGARQAGISTLFELVDEPAPVLADSIQIQQVIINILRNAVDAVRTQDHREIIIRTRTDDETAFVEIADSGPGIAPEVAPNMFKPFVTSKTHGMGMGLSISKRIIESHGGMISAGRGSERGAVVGFSLPLVTDGGLRDEPTSNEH